MKTNDFGYAAMLGDSTPLSPGLDDFSNEPKHEGEKKICMEQFPIRITAPLASDVTLSPIIMVPWKINLNERKLIFKGVHVFTWMFLKIGVTPQIIHFNRVFHYKPSILGGTPIFRNTHFHDDGNNGTHTPGVFHKSQLASLPGVW